MELPSLLLFVLVLVGLCGLYMRSLLHLTMQGYYSYLRTPRWHCKAAICKYQAGFRCRFCYSPIQLNGHHRSYRNLYVETPDDLTCVCNACHEELTKSRRLEKPPTTRKLGITLDQLVRWMARDAFEILYYSFVVKPALARRRTL